MYARIPHHAVADGRVPPASAEQLAQPDPKLAILRHTLSIMTADTDGEITARTLAAACDLTGATVAAIIGAGGVERTHGDPTHRSRLAALPASARRAVRRHCGGPTEALAGLALPAAVTTSLGDGRLLVIAHPQPGRLGASAGSLLALLAAHAQASQERLTQLDQLRRRANSDPLTGLRHHRPFEERLAVATSRTALVAIDVDDFKKINDEYGHQAGDHALVTLVTALRGVLRNEDELYRIGGDEFAVAVDVSGIAEVAAISRRLIASARRIGQTISLGVAVHVPGETGRDTLRRADLALYDAKRAGGDTFRLAAQPSHVLPPRAPDSTRT